jgi:hypothetical protein
MMIPPSDDTPVGYGRPPVHSRFRKGRSGNPSGRRRGKGLHSLLQEALDETVVLQIGGKRRRVSKAEVVIAGLVERSAQGDWHSARLLFDVMQKLEPKGRRDADPDPSEHDDAEDPRERLIREIDRLAEEEAEQERRDAALAEAAAAPDPEAGPDADDTPPAAQRA